MSEVGNLTVTPAPVGASVMDKLVSAFDEVSDEVEAPVEPAKGKGQPSADPRKEPPKKAREEAADEDDENVADLPAVGEGEEGDESAEDEHEAQDTRGTMEDPYSVDELPKDKYIQIKVDGEKKAVSLRELADGYTRTEAFTKRVNQTKLLTQQAQEYVEKAKAFPAKFQEQFRNFTSDPAQLYEFFMATPEREQVLLQAATQLAKHTRQAREDPEYRVRYQRERDETRLRAEREAFETQKRNEIQARENEQRRQQAIAIFTPGWNEGLKKAGFPKLTKETHAKLQEEVLFRCSQRHNQGGVVTSDDVTEFTVRAARAMDLPTAKSAPKPAPSQTKRAPAAPEQRGKDWSKASRRDKVNSPSFFLQGVKTRDLVGR